jgi:hypothetical protein
VLWVSHYRQGQMGGGRGRSLVQVRAVPVALVLLNDLCRFCDCEGRVCVEAELGEQRVLVSLEA